MKELNEKVFDTITEISAYWIGFLMADGNVYNNRVSLTLNNKDINHLYKFKSFLNSGHTICSISTRNIVTIQFTSIKISKILYDYGVTPNKSLTTKISKLELNPHFWRGCIDGDGWISYQLSKKHINPIIQLGLCGSYELVNQFYNFIIKLFPNFKSSIRKDSPNLWEIILCSHYALAMIKILYYNTNIYLDRKYEKAIQTLKEFNMI